MADKNIILKMTPAEDAALSRLIGFIASDVTDAGKGRLEVILGSGSPDVLAIGRINAALNSQR